MDKTKIKQQLKLAKEEFMKKNFSDAAKLCKTILTTDSNNVPCLILYGASLLEMPSRKDESIGQFQKVIDLSPNNVFAWQGAEQYYEKCDRSTVCQQLFYTYGNLLCLETDGTKCKARANKCVELWKNYKTKLDLGVFVSTVLPKIENDEITPQYLAICRVLVEFPFTEDTAPLDEHMENVYAALCKDDSFEHRFEVYCKLVPALKSKGKRRQLVGTLEEMLSVYRDNAVAINFFCESFISNYIRTVTDADDGDAAQLVDEMSASISERCDVLLLAQPANPNSLIAKSIALRRRNGFEDGRRLLRKVLQVADRSWQSWFLLAEIQINVRCYDDVIRCVQQAKRIVKPTFSCYRTMLLWEIEAHCRPKQCCTVQGRRLAIDMYNETPDDRLAECIIAASCNLNDETTAKQYLNANRSAYLEALCLGQFGRPDDALLLLRQIVDGGAPADADATLLLADVLWKSRRFSEAGKLYLEASRVSPHRCDLITKLGHYYRETKRLTVAVTCYEKSVVLNPDDEENGLALSDAYIALFRPAEQETLLNYLKSSRNVKWAALRLGVHCLNAKRYEDAVDNLQLAVKHDQGNVHCLECLGDALVGRGSLLGAKLTYAKCTETDPDRLYPRLQTAKIEYRVGQVDSSVRSLRDIADRHRDDPVALLDAARVFVEHAKSIIDRQVQSSHDLCADACECLHRALCLQHRTATAADVGRYASVWMLFGDACLFVAASMPERLCYVRLASNVFDTEQTDYEVRGLQLYAYSRRCYVRALNATARNASLSGAQKYVWYCMATCYAKNATDARVRRGNVELLAEYKRKAEQAMRKCLSLDPSNGRFWNAMGVVEAIEEPADGRGGCAAAASYRCFVKSLEMEVDAVAYNNLAVTCMAHGDAQLADEAFTLSQHLDPTLVNGWVGKAMLARLDEDCLATADGRSADLFYHSTTLPGLHEESVCGYTESTCRDALDRTASAAVPAPSPPVRRVQHNVDLLVWWTDRNPGDSWAQNALSVLCERVGLYGAAVRAAEQAVRHCSPTTAGPAKTGMRRNLAFGLLRAGRYAEAADEYARMRDEATLNVHDQFGAAFALYKTGRHAEVCAAYEALTGNERADVASAAYVAMAAIAFANGGRGDDNAAAAATTLLLKSIRCDKGNVPALLAAFALGVVTRNSGLSRTILHELVQHRDHPEYSKHVVRFEAYFHYLNRQPAASLRLISRRVHSHPGDGHLWANLGFVLLNYYMADGSKRRPGLGSHMFTRATAVGDGRNKDDELENRALMLTAICNLFEGELNACLRNALKGLHAYPTSAALWTVLLNAVYCRGRVRDAPFLRDHIGFVVNRLSPDESLMRNLSALKVHVP